VIACHTWSFAKQPLREVFPALRALGFDGIELNAEPLPDAPPHVTPAMPQAERREIRAMLDRTGLVVSSISAHVSLIEADPVAREAAVAYTRGCIDLAVEFGAKIVHAFSGAAPAGADPNLAWSWLQRSMHDSASYAAEHGVQFAVEAAVGRLVSTTKDLDRLFDIVDLPVYVNFDPSHLYLAGEDVADSIRRLGARIVHVHVKDARRDSTAGGFSFPPLGEGSIDFDAFFAALRETGYRGFYSLEDEAHDFGYPVDPVGRARSGLEFVRRHLGR
jgi:L-ribulose-5-phosphate 3-epimerase